MDVCNFTTSQKITTLHLKCSKLDINSLKKLIPKEIIVMGTKHNQQSRDNNVVVPKYNDSKTINGVCTKRRIHANL